jgi:hypothetical protein
VVVAVPAYPPSTVILTCIPASPLPFASVRIPATAILPDEPVTLVIARFVPMIVEVVVVVVDELVLVLVAVTVTVLVLVVFTTVVQTP